MDNRIILENLKELDRLNALPFLDIIGYTKLVVDELQSEKNIAKQTSYLINELLEEVLNETEKQEVDISDKLQMIEINGVKVFISGSELEKLDTLKESELVKNEDDHEDQTYMDYGLEDEMTYKDFLNRNREQ